MKLSSSFFALSFLTKTLHADIFYVGHIPRPCHPSWFDHPHGVCWKARTWNIQICL